MDMSVKAEKGWIKVGKILDKHANTVWHCIGYSSVLLMKSVRILLLLKIPFLLCMSSLDIFDHFVNKFLLKNSFFIDFEYYPLFLVCSIPNSRKIAQKGLERYKKLIKSGFTKTYYSHPLEKRRKITKVAVNE